MNSDKDKQDIVALLNRFVFRCREQDPCIAEDFEEDALLLGSEAGEVARGREEINAHFATLFEQPFVIEFTFDSVEIETADDFGWLHAEGAAQLIQPGQQRRLPYRLTGVVEQTDDGWRWKLFHGAEPA